jgi:hypothetical protein
MAQPGRKLLVRFGEDNAAKQTVHTDPEQTQKRISKAHAAAATVQ